MIKGSLVSSDIINGEMCDKMKINKIKWLTAICVWYINETVNVCVGILQKLLKHFFRIKQIMSIYNRIKTVI